MKGRVEGERDQGNAHLVQDRGQIGPAQKETKREKRMSCFGVPPFRLPRSLIPLRRHEAGQE